MNHKKNPERVELMLDCECSTKAHLAVITYDEEWGIELALQASEWRGFFRRLWAALKFVIGADHLRWDTCIVRKQDIPGVIQLLQKAQGQETSGIEGKIY